MKKIGLFPGTFNNLHIGHINVIKKSLNMFDKIYIVIAKNKDKNFDLDKIYKNVVNKLSTYEFSNIEILKTEKNIPVLFDELKCTHIIRGIRDTEDLEYEISLIDSYKKMNNKIQEVIFFSDENYRDVASSKKKLFAFDIDGTLLNDKKELLKSTKKAIAKLLEKEHEVILCTGRNYLVTLDLAKELKIPKYIITSGGSVIYDLIAKDKISTNKYVSKEDIDIAISLAKKYKRELIWNNDENIFRVYFGKDPRSEIKDPSYFIGGSCSDPIYHKWEEVKGTVYDNIIHMSFKAETEIISQEIKKLKNIVSSECIFYETSKVYIDFFNKEIGKFNSIKDLSKKLEIADENIYVFGDSGNDLDMISNFTNGIAMGNAREEVKKVAKHIIGDNNSDSIYNFLLSEGHINE